MPKVGETPSTTYFYTVTCNSITSNKVSVNSVNAWKLEAGTEDDIPLVTSLAPNYPNPFNPVTTIRYTVAHATHVRLLLYDVLGREIITLVDEYQEPGLRSVILDAARLPSGVYFYRMRAGEFTEIRKMVLIK